MVLCKKKTFIKRSNLMSLVTHDFTTEKLFNFSELLKCLELLFLRRASRFTTRNLSIIKALHYSVETSNMHAQLRTQSYVTSQRALTIVMFPHNHKNRPKCIVVMIKREFINVLQQKRLSIFIRMRQCQPVEDRKGTPP